MEFENSNLPNNMNDQITIDKNGLIWLTVDEGLVTFDGKTFTNAEQNITGKENILTTMRWPRIITTSSGSMGKRTSTALTMQNGPGMTLLKLALMGHMKLSTTQNRRGIFCSDEGLTTFKDGQWSNINKVNYKICPPTGWHMQRDSKNRIWIGTFSGSAMIDEQGNVSNFENTKTVLKGKCITSMDEDEDGNLFSPFTSLTEKKGEK